MEIILLLLNILLLIIVYAYMNIRIVDSRKMNNELISAIGSLLSSIKDLIELEKSRESGRNASVNHGDNGGKLIIEGSNSSNVQPSVETEIASLNTISKVRPVVPFGQEDGQ